MASTTSEHRAQRISSIKVDGLFGLFDHKIPIQDSGRPDAPSVLILYGDNGAGKTTILRLVYHLLSKEDNRGHRTALARTPFRTLEVSLTGDYRVTAFRHTDPAIGSYTITIHHGKTLLCKAPVFADQNRVVRDESRPPEERQSWGQLLEQLARLDVSFFFLTDDRKSQDFSTARFIVEEGAAPTYAVQLALAEREALARLRAQEERPLEAALERLDKWIRDEVLKAANVGEANTSTVYADIAKRIANTRKSGGPEQPSSQDLAALLTALDERSKPFAQLGFISHLRLLDIVTALQRSQPSTQGLIADVIAPYVDGLRARLDALQEIQELISLFLKSINGFLRAKGISYDLANGLTITSANGQRLSAAQLSSGERQLLLLLVHVLMARRQATIFLIDEPEISLNVKWQRNLLDTLLGLVRGAPVQFILATHSLELLARHRQYVHRLHSGQSDDA